VIPFIADIGIERVEAIAGNIMYLAWRHRVKGWDLGKRYMDGILERDTWRVNLAALRYSSFSVNSDLRVSI
jgi:hypothetical protein